MPNPKTRRIGNAENPFVVSPDTTEDAPRTIGATPFVSGPMSENVEDRRGEGPDALPSRGTRPANVSDEVPDEEEMKPRLKKQRDAADRKFLSGDKAHFNERIAREMAK